MVKTNIEEFASQCVTEIWIRSPGGSSPEWVDLPEEKQNLIMEKTETFLAELKKLVES